MKVHLPQLCPQRWLTRPGWAVPVVLSLWLCCFDVRGDDGELAARLGQMKQGDELARVEAAYDLGRLGAEGGEAARALEAALADSSERVREVAVVSLLQVGGDANKVLPLLKDPSPKVHARVAEVVLAAGGDVATVIPTLVDLRANSLPGYAYPSVTFVFQAFGQQSAKAAAPLLIHAAAADESKVRAAAWLSLDDVGPLDPSAVSLLSQLLDDRRADVRSSAADALRPLGVEARAAIPNLRRLLDDEHAVVRVAAAAALRAIDPDDHDAVSVLIPALKIRNERVRQRAARGLGEVATADAVPALIDSLNDADQFVREYSRAALINVGRPAVPHLIRRIETSRMERIHQGAAGVLENLGTEAHAAVPALVGASEDSVPETRIAAAKALAAIDPDGEAVVSALIKLLVDRESSVRAAAATALGECDSTTSLRQVLSIALTDASSTVRLAVAKSLMRHNDGAESVVPALLELLASADTEAALSAIRLLGEMGADAEDAIPALVEAMGLRSGVSAGFGGYSISQSVPWTLAKIGPSAVPSLIDALEHQDPQIRGHAAEALGKLGPAAKAAVPALLERLTDDGEREGMSGCFGYDRQVREDVIEALGAIGSDARAAVEPLVLLLETDNDQFLQLLSESLGGIGRAALPAVTPLAEVADHDDPCLRAAALVALSKIDPDSPILTNGFIELLTVIRSDRPSEGYYTSACGEVWEEIVRMGPRAQPLIPTLVQLVTSPLLDPSYRCRAARTLLQLEPENQIALESLQRMARQPNTFIAERAAAALAKSEP